MKSNFSSIRKRLQNIRSLFSRRSQSRTKRKSTPRTTSAIYRPIAAKYTHYDPKRDDYDDDVSAHDIDSKLRSLVMG
jgi:hypothetical protein